VPPQRAFHAHKRIQRLKPLDSSQRLGKSLDILSQFLHQRRRRAVISPTRRPAPETHAHVHSARFFDVALAHQSRDVGVTHRPALHAIVDDDAFSHEFRRRDASETRLALEKFDVEDDGVIVIVIVIIVIIIVASRARERERGRAPRGATTDDDDARRAPRCASRARHGLRARRAMNEESRPTARRATVRRARRSFTPHLGRETRANIPRASPSVHLARERDDDDARSLESSHFIHGGGR
jgi:hypothetical protein